MRPRTSVVDSNVLYSIELTDLFLTFATRRLIRLHWSARILEEVRLGLSRTGRMSPIAIERRIASMQNALQDALRVAPDRLVDEMRIASSDRHVLALAVASEADSIITLNLRDFPRDYCESLGIAVVTPDEAARELAYNNLVGVSQAVEEIAARRRKPPVTVDELLKRWAPHLPTFVDSMSGESGRR